jgi:predicted enzyme related to lactoylglutathione lyase
VITGVGKIVVPVDDRGRAKDFWTRQIGFDVVRDETYGDERWIEVRPPAGAPILVLSQRAADEPRREVVGELPHSPVFFECEDVERTYAELSERGVTFPVAPQRRPFGWWALFEDPDGTRYALGQWTSVEV